MKLKIEFQTGNDKKSSVWGEFITLPKQLRISHILFKSNLVSVVCLGCFSTLLQKLSHFSKCDRYSGFSSGAKYK